jgi:Zn finger protein HypA/HybF involved in hydrogenase expression
MTDRWWCCNCMTVTALDSHGRCPRCQSDAVAFAEGLLPVLTQQQLVDVLELERLYA